MRNECCYTPQCPRHEECSLWHNALEAIAQGQLTIGVTNPKLIEEHGGYEHCPMYHEWKLRRYARGMRWRYGALTVEAQQAIHQELTHHFGYALIGRIRRGDEVISPEDQKYIHSVFARFSDEVEPEFLDFEMHYIKPQRRK